MPVLSESDPGTSLPYHLTLQAYAHSFLQAFPQNEERLLPLPLHHPLLCDDVPA